MTSQKIGKLTMKQSKIAILGGAGFLGSRLGNRLFNSDIAFKKYDIEAKSDTNISSLDIEKTDTLNQLEGANTIINLAAVHRDDIRPIRRYDDVNVQGSVNVCDVARKYNINKIIFKKLNKLVNLSSNKYLILHFILI